jgi:ABC-type histidine transport system ATPase subunit
MCVCLGSRDGVAIAGKGGGVLAVLAASGSGFSALCSAWPLVDAARWPR